MSLTREELTLADQIEQFISSRKHVSFVELVNRFPRIKGDLSLCFGKTQNIILWNGISESFGDIFEFLWRERCSICIVPTSPIVYMADGAVPNMPLAKGNYGYKSPHWSPVVLNPGSQGNLK